MTPERLAQIREDVESSARISRSTQARCPLDRCAYCERAELLAEVDRLQRQLADDAANPWEREDQSYEVLIDDTVYDEATSLGDADYKAARALEEIEAGELADVPIRIRRTTQETREARP